MIKKIMYETLEVLFPQIKHRPMIEFIKEKHSKDLIGCEVGIGRGKHMRSIFHALDIKKMYAVDIDISKFRFKDKRVVLIEGDSLEVNNMINDDSLDFCYLDADHTSVYGHILVWYPKVKPGGVIGGHDFGTELNIVRDVLSFVDENNYDLNSKHNDWWVKK